MQYKLPNPDVARFPIPSYASHVIIEREPSKELAAKTTVKVYRLEHQTMMIDRFETKMPDGHYQDPYHPSTYRPYFLGEYDARGELVNPQEELLYWMVPVIPYIAAPNDKANPFKKDYVDYMSVHALEWSARDVLMGDEAKGPVFNWSQLR